MVRGEERRGLYKQQTEVSQIRSSDTQTVSHRTAVNERD